MKTNISIAPNSPKHRPWKVATTINAVFFCIIAVALLGMFIPTTMRLLTWIGTLILLALFTVLVGRGITGRWLGLLIDERRKMSLSRFQTVLWSLLLLSAFLAAALNNLHTDMFSLPIDALSITLPPELLALLGVSLTSLVGAPLILNVKSKQQQHIDANESFDQADWYDMFKGDDDANADYLDLSKVQMFYFTIILILVYGVALAIMFIGVDSKNLIITAFPPVSATMVTLLGISHAGYLINRAVPRKIIQTTDQPRANVGSQ